MRPAPKRGALPTALWLLRSGLWPVPISSRTDDHAGSPGKSPVGPAWGVRTPTRDGLTAAFAAHPGAGIGIALGPAAGAVDVEVDDREKAAPLLGRVSLGETLGWRSARGDHRVYAWDERLAALTGKAVVYLIGGAVELRVGQPGKQLVAVCPPTVGTNRRRRLWNGVWELAPFPEELLQEAGRERDERSSRPDRPPPPHGLPTAYAAALRGESRLVRAAQEGTRNRTLNRAAFKIGQLVAAGQIGRGVVEAELTAAAEAVGLPEREIAATLRSGLEAGLNNPRG